ncbi:hypothetical protein Taro_036711 [Colocasia esculenta]|uniref:Uncharacterized protein n=1 Tax=Colocasia esculenta TaxID=4460 RepID=A0A843WE54_COLES|nr:hypothetical protein [Colocasia esculenta]
MKSLQQRDGQYRIDSHATPTMLNSLMYKLSYYRFVETDGKGFDRVRRTEIGKKHFKLTHFEEHFFNDILVVATGHAALQAEEAMAMMQLTSKPNFPVVHQQQQRQKLMCKGLQGQLSKCQGHWRVDLCRQRLKKRSWHLSL